MEGEIKLPIERKVSVFAPIHTRHKKLATSINNAADKGLPFILKTIATVLLFSFSSVSYADCDSLVAKLNTFLNYPNSEPDGEQSFTSCKAWPADPSKTIVALVHFQKGSYFNAPPVPGNGLFDLDVLIVKSDNGEILQRHLQKGALSSDAMALSGITIDTARYTLAQQIRAFGVRADFSHSGGSNPAHYQVINLYIAQSKKISQV